MQPIKLLFILMISFCQRGGALPAKFVFVDGEPRLEVQGERGQSYSVSIFNDVRAFPFTGVHYVGSGQIDFITFDFESSKGLFAQVRAASGRTVLDSDDSPPIPRYQPVPVYPINLRREGTEGEAVVGFIVRQNGIVTNITPFSYTHIEFYDAAAAAIQHWLFEPAKVNGQAVNTRVRIPIPFSIETPDPPANSFSEIPEPRKTSPILSHRR